MPLCIYTSIYKTSCAVLCCAVLGERLMNSCVRTVASAKGECLWLVLIDSG